MKNSPVFAPNGALVDAFVGPECSGNPAGVIESERSMSVCEMAFVATELNQTETIFLRRSGPGRWRVRWFTPTTQVKLCGHATLAAAHWLWESGRDATEEIVFQAENVSITAIRLADDRAKIIMPIVPLSSTPLEQKLNECFPGASIQYIGCTAHVDNLERNALIRTDPEGLRALHPDLRIMASIPIGGFIATAESDIKGFDYMSRYFAPACGINEDHVTGSAQCTLVTYWAPIVGKTAMKTIQLSQRRGIVELELVADANVALIGRARTTTDLYLRNAISDPQQRLRPSRS
jgi:predicted PhzF superfamily epimerase YddE/YHI9